MEKKEKKLKLTTRRIIVLIIAFILLLLLIFGICKLFAKIFAKEQAYGNLSNTGLVVADGRTTYYNKYDKGIIKVKGDKEYQITEEPAYSLTMYNGKLYYITISNINTIDLISVETNGEGYQKIKTINTSISKFYIADNSIYYAKSTNEMSGISKISLENGEDKMIIASNIEDFVLDKNTIYYTDKVGFLHSVNLDGSSKKDLATEYKIGKFQLANKWIYFYDSKEDALCRVKKNGSSRSVVTTFVKNDTFNVSSKYIYYLDKANGRICRCDLKGNKSKEIVSIESASSNINIVNGVIYYLDKCQDGSQTHQMYRVKTNGKAAKEIVY